MRARRIIQLCRCTMARRRLKNPSFVDFVVLSCAPRDFSVIFGTIPISLGIPTEEVLSYARAQNYSIMSKHNGTPSSQICIFCRFCRVIVRATGFLPHFLEQYLFPLAFRQRRVSAMRARRIIQLSRITVARRCLKNLSPTSQKSIFCRFFRVIVRAAGFLRHFWHKAHFPRHSDRGGSQVCDRAEPFNYVEALWHAVVSKIHLLSILSCYRARRGISPPFLAQ